MTTSSDHVPADVASLPRARAQSFGLGDGDGFTLPDPATSPLRVAPGPSTLAQAERH